MESIYKKNSKNIKKGDVFFSIQGKLINGNDFIPEAIENGATKIIIQKDNLLPGNLEDEIRSKNLSYEYVENIYQKFAELNKEFYQIKDTDFTILGVTGTKGKTTTANCLFSFLRKLGISTGLMSSTGHRLNEEHFHGGEKLTTEMADTIYRFLYEAKIRKINHIILEVSSHAFSQKRVFGITFDGFIFTNFSQEHGESHPTQKDYFLAKCLLYQQVKENGIIVLNKKDKKVWGSKKYKKTNQTINYFTENNKKEKDNCYEIINETILETEAKIIFNEKEYTFKSSWTGNYNIENIFASILLTHKLKNLSEEEINMLLRTVVSLPSIPGRNEKYVLKNNAIVSIEKAPTPNSVSLTIKRLKQFTNNLIAIFGCGGDRDKKKRPLLGKIIETYADTIYVTTDNPRFENIDSIFQDIARGFNFSKNIFFIHNREEAIKLAIEQSTKETIIALIGKGDETYQDINGQKYPFSEKKIIAEYIAI